MNIVCKIFAVLVGFAIGWGLVSMAVAEDEVPPGKVSTGLMQGPAQPGEESLYWGHLGRGDDRLAASNTLYEGRDILLTPGTAYRIEVRAREFRPSIWIQRPGVVDPNRAIVDVVGQWKIRRWPSPAMGRMRRVGEAVLDFTYPGALQRSYLLVINTTLPSDDGFYRVAIKRF